MGDGYIKVAAKEYMLNNDTVRRLTLDKDNPKYATVSSSLRYTVLYVIGIDEGRAEEVASI